MNSQFHTRTVDWVMGAVVSIILGCVLSVVRQMEPLLIAIVSICAGIMVVLVSIRLREPVIDRRNARVSAINGEITRLDSLGSHLDWNQELLEMNAFLRGLGERQKAKAFMQTVGQVPVEKRAEAAKRFLRGMLGEARER